VPDLLVTSNGQPDQDDTLIKVTPETAGWEYVGFEVLRLEAGRTSVAGRACSMDLRMLSIYRLTLSIR
jgi:5-deoxy-D-glucuronate isomerase